MTKTTPNRIESLDYLRGIMAFMVMCYHYAIFSGKSDYSFLNKFGIYAVSTFYILSGLSLAIAYHRKINSWNDLINFFIKRVFRIFPLMWLAISLALLFAWMGDSAIPTIEKIILNYTLLYAIFDLQGYIPTGAWSIGNEMVFYLFFPFFIKLVDFDRKTILFTIFIISILIEQYVSFYLLNESIGLDKQWDIYINHFNQIYFFIIGILIFIFFMPNSYTNKKYIFTIVTLIMFAILFTPYTGESIELVTGWFRLYYSFLFALLTLVFFVGIEPINNGFGKFLKFLGDVSYSIYLLHPLVAVPVIYILSDKLHFISNRMILYFLISLPLTLIFSYVSYNFIEKPMMRVGKILQYLKDIK